MPIRLLHNDEDVARCFGVMRELRPKLTSPDELVRSIRTMRAEGAQLAALEHEGQIATLACFRIHTMLVSGVTMYVDDLVTSDRFRSRGHGRQMLEWLMNYARERGCTTFSLDSGTFRQEAHAFYFREGMRITSFHFAREL